jgi:hypothetical protein
MPAPTPSQAPDKTPIKLKQATRPHSGPKFLWRINPASGQCRRRFESRRTNTFFLF